MTGWNLPPGCTTADIDRAFGGDPRECECIWCGVTWDHDDYDTEPDDLCKNCRDVTEEQEDMLVLGKSFGQQYTEKYKRWWSVFCYRHPDPDLKGVYLYSLGTPHSDWEVTWECANDEEAIDRLVFYADRILRGVKPCVTKTTLPPSQP